MIRLTLPLALLLGCKDGGKDDDSDPPVTTDTADTAGGGADGNDSIETAEDRTSLDLSAIGFEAVGQGAINPPGDRDFYAIRLEAGEPYALSTIAYDDQRDLVVLDTVLRLYDADGNFISENDDMPFRLRETDSGIWYMPKTTGTYYVEVLEYGDWAGERANGGSNYTYTLVAGHLELTEHEGMNDSIEEVDANTTISDTAASEDPAFYGGIFSSADVSFLGSFQTAGDVDLFPRFYEIERRGQPGYTPEPYFFLSAALWENYGGNPRMSLLNEAGDVLASSTDLLPDARTAITFILDSAILVKVDEGSRYYIKMENEDGTATSQEFYVGSFVNYLPTAATLEEAEGSNDDQVTADLTVPRRSTATDGLYFIGIWGALPTGDDADWFKLDKDDVDTFEDKYISVVVQALTVGSALDPKVKLVDASGNVLAEATVDAEDATVGDPTIVDFNIDVTTNVFVVVEADGRTGPDSQCNYLVGMWVSDTPLFD